MGHRSRQAGNGFRSRCFVETLFSENRIERIGRKIKRRNILSVMNAIVCSFSAQLPPLEHGLLNLEVSRSHTTTHSVTLLWTSDQLVAETST
jgi:hypothetical protein